MHLQIILDSDLMQQHFVGLDQHQRMLVRYICIYSIIQVRADTVIFFFFEVNLVVEIYTKRKKQKNMSYKKYSLINKMLGSIKYISILANKSPQIHILRLTSRFNNSKPIIYSYIQW